MFFKHSSILYLVCHRDNLPNNVTKTAMAHSLVSSRFCRLLLLVPSHSAKLHRAAKITRPPAFYLGQDYNLRLSLLKRYIHERAIGALEVQSSDLLETNKEEEENEEEEEQLQKPTTKKSRNEKKREAARAVKWGMKMAKFSPSQIKRIIRLLSLEDEVFNAVMLAKKFGSDVREGKRRQFNYIGGLLRKVQPDLMEAILQATKDGEMDKFHTLLGSDKKPMDESVELDGNESEEEEEMDEEVLVECAEMAKRWSEGLISGDASITREVYSIYNIDFDRKELRKLVREVCAKQEYKLLEENSTEIEAETALSQANKSLYNFLFLLAKQISVAGY